MSAVYVHEFKVMLHKWYYSIELNNPNFVFKFIAFHLYIFQSWYCKGATKLQAMQYTAKPTSKSSTQILLATSNEENLPTSSVAHPTSL